MVVQVDTLILAGELLTLITGLEVVSQLLAVLQALMVLQEVLLIDMIITVVVAPAVLTVLVDM
jgi:hypothetical protein